MKKKTPKRVRRVRRPMTSAEKIDSLCARVAKLEQVLVVSALQDQLPLDRESARVVEEHRNTMARKRAGETGVKWNGDPRIRYQQCALLYPHAKVAFRQLSPVDDDNVPVLHVSLARDYDDLVTHLREKHWRGERASYKWTVFDDNQPQWATGIIQFEVRGDQQLPPPAPPHLPGWYNGVYWTGQEWVKPPLPPPPPPYPPGNVVGIKKKTDG